MPACLLIRDDVIAADVAAENLPDPADHRMALLAIAEEVVGPLPHQRLARFGRKVAAAAYRENGVQQAGDRIEAGRCLAIGLHPLMAIKLVMLERDMLRIEIVEIPVDDLAFLGVTHL